MRSPTELVQLIIDAFADPDGADAGEPELRKDLAELVTAVRAETWARSARVLDYADDFGWTRLESPGAVLLGLASDPDLSNHPQLKTHLEASE